MGSEGSGPSGSAAPLGTGRLLEEARGGSEDAWRSLYERYRVSLVLAVRTQVPSVRGLGFDEEDVLQSAFLSAWRRILSFEYKGEGSFRRWLRTIVLNNVIDRVRAQPPVAGGGPLRLDDAADTETPTQVLKRREDESALLDRLSNLDETDREILVMRDFEKKRWRDVAEVLEMPHSTVRRRYVMAWTELTRSIRS